MASPNSGKPYTRTFTATTTATTFFSPVPTKFVQIRNEGANAVNVFFDSADSADATRAVVLAAAGSEGSYFEGPAFLLAGDDPGNATRGGITLTAAAATSDVRCVFYSEDL